MFRWVSVRRVMTVVCEVLGGSRFCTYGGATVRRSAATNAGKSHSQSEEEVTEAH